VVIEIAIVDVVVPAGNILIVQFVRTGFFLEAGSFMPGENKNLVLQAKSQNRVSVQILKY
jgi:hypothetical protein